MSGRRSVLFIFGCIVLIAASLSVVGAQIGLSATGAGLLFFSVVTALGLAHLQFERIRDRLDLEDRIDSLSEEFGGPQVRVHNEFEALRARVERLDKSLAERVRLEFDPIARESEVFSRLVKDLAESLAIVKGQVDALDARIEVEARRAVQKAADAAPKVQPVEAAAPVTAPPVKAPPVKTPEPKPVAEKKTQPQHPEPVRSEARPEPQKKPEKQIVRTRVSKTTVEEVRGAIAAGRMEIHLQPIVALPQRRVAWYEAYTRLRTADGMILEPEDFLPIAEEHKLIAVIDSFVLHKVPEIFDHFDARRSDAGLFCNISAVSLLDHRVFERLRALSDKIRRFDNQLVLEFSQHRYREMAAVEHETLNALKEMGFRYSIDQVRNLDTDWAALAADGIDFVKIPAEEFLQDPESVNLDIHLADLARLIARKGLTVVATHIEDESSVVEIIDQEIRLAQGYLFGQPRLLRLDSVLARSKRRNESADERVERERNERRNDPRTGMQTRLRSALKQARAGGQSVDRVIK